MMQTTYRRWWFVEVALAEAVVLMALWLWSPYAAFLITLVGSLLVLSALVIAGISEWLEPTRIPKRWFILAMVVVATALATGALYVLISGGRFDFFGAL